MYIDVKHLEDTIKHTKCFFPAIRRIMNFTLNNQERVKEGLNMIKVHYMHV
jgi:hypothetical protein